jgi:hypothetical protein
MITVSNETKDLIKKGYSLSTSAGATIEYNLNSMVEYVKATTNPENIENPFSAAFKKLFPIDTIYKPFRPLSPGIKYLVHTNNNTDTPVDSFERPRDLEIGTRPRLYYPGPDMVYKYWLAPKNTNINLSLEYFSDEAKTVPKLVPTNKIIARFETSHDTPTSWTISGVKQDNTTITASGTVINSSGEATIYYNGTTWSTTEPTTYTTTQYLKKISLTAVNSNTGKFLGVIELSPRWVMSIDSDIVSFTVNKETTSDDTSIVPVGVITANYLSLLITKYNTASRQIVEYDRSGPIDNSKLYLFKNAIIRPHINIGDGSSVQKVPQGVFYVSSWSLSEFGEASIDATDAAKILQDTICPQLLVESSPVTSVIKRILDSVGFSNYKINIKKTDGKVDDDSIPSLAYWWSDGEQTVWEVLQELCRDIQMNAFVDEYNVLNFYTRNFIYDKELPTSWIFTNEEIKSGSNVEYAPNIIRLSTKELFSANNVRVRYKTAFVSTNSESSSPLWKSESSFLGAGSLATDIDDDSTKFQLNQNTINSARVDKILDQFNGYVLINGEVIEYDGVWYQYVPKEKDTTFTPPRDKPPVRVLIKNQSDIWKYSALAKPGYKNFYPTGEYNIKTRGALSTSKMSHKKTLNSYINSEGESNSDKFTLNKKLKLTTPDIAKLKPGVSSLSTPASESSETVSKSFMAISNLDTDKRTFDIAVKQFNSIDLLKSHFSFGTRMFFDSQLNSPEQAGGIGFCLDQTGENGYYVLVRTTAYAGLQKDIMIIRVKNGKLTVLKDSQQTSTKTLAGIYAGSSYNIDVLVKSEIHYTSDTLTKNTITVFINGFKIEAIDSGTDSVNLTIPPVSITKNVGLHCGQGIAYFEYLYAKSIDEDVYKNISLTRGYEYNGVYADDTLSMLFGDLIYNAGQTADDENGALFEFGTTAREIRKVKESYDDESRPAVPITFRTALNKYVKILDQRLQPFGAETYVLNNTSTTVVLDDSNNTSFYVLGNSIRRSGAIDYDTDQSEDSSNKEFVVFESSWIQSEEDAKTLADWIKSSVLNKGRFVDIEVFGNPLISAGDIVSIKYPVLGMSETDTKYLVVRCSLQYSEGVTTTLSCRAI